MTRNQSAAAKLQPAAEPVMSSQPSFPARRTVVVCRSDDCSHWLVLDIPPYGEPSIDSEGPLSIALKASHGRAFGEGQAAIDLIVTNQTVHEFRCNSESFTLDCELFAAETRDDPNMWACARLQDRGFVWSATSRFVRSGLRSQYADMQHEEARRLDALIQAPECRYLHDVFLSDFVDAVREHHAAEVDRAARYDAWVEEQSRINAPIRKRLTEIRCAAIRKKTAHASAQAEIDRNHAERVRMAREFR